MLEPDWNRLNEAAQYPNAFATYGWFRVWLTKGVSEHRSGFFVPQVLVLKKAGSIAGIAPLVLRTSSRLGLRIRRLEFVTPNGDYNELTVGNDPKGQIDAVIDFLAGTPEQWDVVHLRDLRDTGEGTTRIECALRRAGLPYTVEYEVENCPWLPIDGGSTDRMARLPGHARRNLRRRVERAQAAGMRVRIIENPHQEPGLVETLAALDYQKHLHRRTPTFIGTYAEVIQPLFEALGPRGWLYVALLEIAGKPAAFQLGYRCGDKLWDYAKAYDPAFSALAPGTLLLPALLDYGFQHGFREYDFLRGEEEYKLVWSTGMNRRLRLVIWNHLYASRLRKFAYHDVAPTAYRLMNKAISRRKE